MNPQRQLRLRVLDALEREVKQFRTREELYPLRVPREPLAFDDVIAHALGDGQQRFDPGSLRSRTVLRFEWDGGSAWELWMIVLPSGLKLFCDSGEDESRVLASGGRNLGDESERLFVELLCESSGDHFGIELSGGAPARVRSSVADRGFLADVLVNLFEGTDAEESIRGLARADDLPLAGDGSRGFDFRSDVETWLDEVLD